ncbi:hypothetical protein V9L05_01430 [Bernardetia sp. Wsw4-3y2]|uniref:hypothetical protein n=1 Tax=Bernardetia sp. Wsw4-3y2 TaxID=3127471 RepID=UPI0030D536D2
MSEAVQAPQEQKEKRIYYDVAKSLTKVEEYLREYNEDKESTLMIRLNRVPLLLRIYRLCLSKYNANKHQNIKVITETVRDADTGEAKQVKTLALVTKVSSLATHFQCHKRTVTRQLSVIRGEAAKRADVAPPQLLEVFGTSCYGLTLSLNPAFLVLSERKEQEEEQV